MLVSLPRYRLEGELFLHRIDLRVLQAGLDAQNCRQAVRELGRVDLELGPMGENLLSLR